MRRTFRYGLTALGLVFVLAICAPIWPKNRIRSITIYEPGFSVKGEYYPGETRYEWETVWGYGIWESNIFD